MRSFLGVPVVARGRVIGAVYLTDKEGAPSFSDDDERLIGLLAAHAAIAIENARLYERSRELSIVEERNRLARELHDSVIQQLFGVSLAVESAGTLLERDPAAAVGELDARARARARGDGRAARRWSSSCARRRSRRDGLASALRKHVDVLRRVSAQLDRADARRPAAAGGRRVGAGVPDRAGGAAERAAPRRRRAHRGAARGRRTGRSCCAWPTTGAASTSTDGAVRGRRLGLTSMEERAAELGGTLDDRLGGGQGHARAARGGRRDPRPDRRRPRGRAPGAAHVPRPPGRHRGGRARRPTARRRSPRRGGPRPTSCCSTSRCRGSTASRRCRGCARRRRRRA